MTEAITYLDAGRMAMGLKAGIQRLFQRREYIDRLNVFPVPDRDTGTNMAFSFKVVYEAVSRAENLTIKQLMKRVASASLDGSRGNSGAIMAQYFHGFSAFLEEDARLDARTFANASMAGARAAWTAMAEPIAGTLPTVLEDFSSALKRLVEQGTTDIYRLLEHGVEAARQSLARTPELLPVLKQSGVVDAGGQGFVDLLDGIWEFMEKGATEDLIGEIGELPPEPGAIAEMDSGSHRFCTECVIEGRDLDRAAVMAELNRLDSSSLVVAGGRSRIRVHIHVNNPGDVYLVCGQFGELHQQKADDMSRQVGLMNHSGRVAVVTDSGADIPFEEQERLGIHMVSARLNFGATEYIDYVSLMPADLYRMLVESEESPKTSQPPVGDFARQYDLLTGHGYEVISVGLSEKLSGTTQAARTAAERYGGRVRVFDSMSGSCGEGLLAVIAAEAAKQDMTLDQIEQLLLELRPACRTFGFADDLSYLVRGGRVPGWVKKVTDFLHISPLLTEKKGRFTLAGFTTGIGIKPSAIGRVAVRKMKKDVRYRVIIAHGANPDGAHELRRYILERHPLVHSCHITEAGPALGVHLGPGGLVVGFLPQPEQLN
jgi:DegV family protein with EDD domain